MKTSPGVRAPHPHSFLGEQHRTRAADDMVHETGTSTRKCDTEIQVPASERLSAFPGSLSEASLDGITGTSQMSADQNMQTDRHGKDSNEPSALNQDFWTLPHSNATAGGLQSLLKD